MNTTYRVMRVMTHVNMGAALGMAAWVAWSGLQVAAGQWKVRGYQVPAHAAERALEAQSVSPPCCFIPADQPTLDRLEMEARRDVERLLAQAETRGAA